MALALDALFEQAQAAAKTFNECGVEVAHTYRPGNQKAWDIALHAATTLREAGRSIETTRHIRAARAALEQGDSLVAGITARDSEVLLHASWRALDALNILEDRVRAATCASSTRQKLQATAASSSQQRAPAEGRPTRQDPSAVDTARWQAQSVCAARATQQISAAIAAVHGIQSDTATLFRKPDRAQTAPAHTADATPNAQTQAPADRRAATNDTPQPRPDDTTSVGRSCVCRNLDFWYFFGHG